MCTFGFCPLQGRPFGGGILTQGAAPSSLCPGLMAGWSFRPFYAFKLAIHTPQGLFTTYSSLLSKSKAGDDAKRGGNGGEHGDEDLEDFAPDSCFVCFHGFEKVKGER